MGWLDGFNLTNNVNRIVTGEESEPEQHSGPSIEPPPVPETAAYNNRYDARKYTL